MRKIVIALLPAISVLIAIPAQAAYPSSVHQRVHGNP